MQNLLGEEQSHHRIAEVGRNLWRSSPPVLFKSVSAVLQAVAVLNISKNGESSALFGKPIVAFNQPWIKQLFPMFK